MAVEGDKVQLKDEMQDAESCNLEKAVGGDKVQLKDEMQDAESCNLEKAVGGDKVQLKDDTFIKPNMTSNDEKNDAEASTSITQEGCSEIPTPPNEGAIESGSAPPPSYNDACQAIPKPDDISGRAGPNSPFCPAEVLEMIPPDLLDSQHITDIERACRYVQCFSVKNKQTDPGNITIFIEEYDTQERNCCCFNFCKFF